MLNAAAHVTVRFYIDSFYKYSRDVEKWALIYHLGMLTINVIQLALEKKNHTLRPAPNDKLLLYLSHSSGFKSLCFPNRSAAGIGHNLSISYVVYRLNSIFVRLLLCRHIKYQSYVYIHTITFQCFVQSQMSQVRVYLYTDESFLIWR